MEADEAIKKVEENFARLSKMPVAGVVGLSKTEEGWVVLLEALERRAIPDTMDILGLYEVRLDNDGNLLSFERKRLRKRGETKEE
jgi:hypothetical protein